ncbi:MAG: IS21-like element helper ATPase IstB [Desulfovermiculus sp.]
MSVDREDLCAHLKRLKLRRIRQLVEAEDDEVFSGPSDPLEFLFELTTHEVQARDETRRQRLFRRAKFPAVKTLDDFDFEVQKSADESKLRKLARLDFIDKNENVVFLGPPGVGKTHLATALGVCAVEESYQVRFTSAEELIDTLYSSLADGTFKQRLRRYGKHDLLIIDELGYLNLDRTASNHFFQVINQAYEKQSLILTSNRPYQEWAGLFDDPVVVSAILDRLLHHGDVLKCL